MSPLDNPDAVISAGHYHYGRPLGIRGPARWREWLRRILRRKPTTQRFMLFIVYRDYQTRTRVVNFAPGLIGGFVEKLLAADTIRSVECGEMLFRGRKSFGSDYDPENLLAALPLTDGASASTLGAHPRWNLRPAPPPLPSKTTRPQMG